MATDIFLHEPRYVTVTSESKSTITVSMEVEYLYGPPGQFFPVRFHEITFANRRDDTPRQQQEEK